MIRPKKNVDNAVVVIGVCAMAKKSQSTPMKEILRRLDEYFDKFKILIFPESVILNDPVNTWPLCDCLISFHSKGFPLNKAIEYQKLRKPYVVNDLNRQFELLDRGKVYTVLKQHNIETPRYGLYNSKLKSTELIEDDDQITLDGQTFNKPFVEKPLSAEDHNINIYFQSSVGGGSVRLFRKINNRSSIYCPDSKIRREGSYIYEDYLPTDGIDVKVYAVGPSYAHAEARKSPGLDGKVERDSNGKEIRYPIILSNEEKLIARKVVLAFKQTVCGFDFLRSDDKSYVCDVNGFSFVKTSKKYYDDTARILGDIIMHNCAGPLSIPYKPSYQPDDPPLVSTTYGKMMELRCVLGVIRHGDRTPKQKMKMEVRHKKWFDLYYKYALNSSKKAPKTPKMVDLKLKRPNQLQEVLDITRDLLRELENASPRSVDERASSPELDGNRQKLETLKMVLEMYGHFSGINRKVQLKYQPRGRQRSRTSDTDIETLRVPSLLLILKWGGELTPAGRIQAEELGKAFRCLYPGGQGNYGGDSRGLGFLRLHSTFRHDLKIYASDEGRVQMTAAAFAKGLLALEGELTPILVQMVKSADTNGLLDDDYDARNCQAIVKKYLHGYLQQDKYVDSFDMKQLDPMGTRSIQNALTCIENPRKNCDRIYDLVFKLVGSIRAKVAAEGSGIFLYLDETLLLALRRWEKLLRDFRRCRRKTGNVQYDISKIPDIYDCVKYDLEHNSRVIVFDQIEDLYICSKYMADIVVPQEYGITVQQKLKIAAGICTPLMRKLKRDLKHCVENANMTSSLMGSVSNSLKHSLSPSVSATPIAPIKPTKEITDNKTETSEVSSRTEPENVTRLDPRAVQGIATPFRHVRTRLYFTSESHIHSMMNLLRNADLIDNPISDEQWQRALNFLSSVTEFNYMAQLVLMLYEDTTKDESSDQRFHVELHFSPGALPCIQTTHVAGLGYRPKSRETEVLTNTSRTLSTSTNKTDSLQNDSTHSTMPAEPVNQPNSGPVNIVAVNNGPDPPITSAELALHSPVSGSPQSSTRGILQHSVSVAADSFAQNHASKQTEVNSITLDSNKSSSSSSAILVRSTSESHFVKSRNSEAMNYNSCLVTVNENVVDSSRTKVKYNTPAVKHHTTNLKLLKHGENKLISTDVIKGYTHVKEDKMPPPDPTVLSTAVITRGASAPDLKIFDEPCHQDQDSDIKYFVPPLRSLETLHNQLDWRQMDSFLSKITHLTGISPMSSSSLRSTSNLEEENKVSTKGKTCASSRSPLDNGKTRSKSKEGSDSKCPITEANIITVNKPRKARDDLTIEYGGGKDRSTKSKSPSENTQRSIIADINAPTTPPFVHDPERAYQNKFNKRWSRKYSIPEKQKCILLAEERSSSEINKKEKSKHKKDRSRSKKKNDTKTKEKDKSKKNKTS